MIISWLDLFRVGDLYTLAAIDRIKVGEALAKNIDDATVRDFWRTRIELPAGGIWYGRMSAPQDHSLIQACPDVPTLLNFVVEVPGKIKLIIKNVYAWQEYDAVVVTGADIEGCDVVPCD
jgi:hypothetical protein